MKLREAVAVLLLASATGPATADGLMALGPISGFTLPSELAAAGVEVAGATLAALIREGRAEAVGGGLHPLDPTMRARMAGTFPAAILDRVRWGIASEGSRLRAAIFVPGPVDAVTLGDVIVFRDAAAAADPRLMAHELAHVLQYEGWGVDGFARRYVVDAAGLEAEAERVADGWVRAPSVSPRPVQRPAR